MLILKVIVVFLFIYTIIYLKQSRKKQLSKQDHKSGIIIYYKKYYIDFYHCWVRAIFKKPENLTIYNKPIKT